jgi:hypothetical protein
MMASFDEARFRAQVSATISKLKTILDNTRAPQYPADVPIMKRSTASPVRSASCHREGMSMTQR